ncbi:hypothetical protein EUX98_g1395 [Antrodiella citrinella]|uniref:Uncharacterized protein n=1 Tax=Antrodiella citrinella TaxID=2447956 RepID=A0A4S4N378_9APHY|nr:hypothetical protein EUX98_g1395 [Antrodiella citrinella]
MDNSQADYEPSQDLLDDSQPDESIARRRTGRDIKKPATRELYIPGGALDSQTTDSQFVEGLYGDRKWYLDVGVQTDPPDNHPAVSLPSIPAYPPVKLESLMMPTLCNQISTIKRENEDTHPVKLPSESVSTLLLKLSTMEAECERVKTKLSSAEGEVDLMKKTVSRLNMVNCQYQEDLEDRERRIEELVALQEDPEGILADDDDLASLSGLADAVTSDGQLIFLDENEQSQCVLSPKEVRRRFGYGGGVKGEGFEHSDSDSRDMHIDKKRKL